MASQGALHTVSHPCLSRLFLQQLFAGRRGVSAFCLARLQDPVSGSLRCQIQAIGGVGECGKKAKQIISLNKSLAKFRWALNPGVPVPQPPTIRAFPNTFHSPARKHLVNDIPAAIPPEMCCRTRKIPESKCHRKPPNQDIISLYPLDDTCTPKLSSNICCLILRLRLLTKPEKRCIS